MAQIRPFFLVTDIGFLLYWAVTASGIIPESYLFKDYHDPLLVAWNWSFLPLDLLVSVTGLASLYLWRRNDPRTESVALVSLALTSASGLQAVGFWIFRMDFDPVWWIPNLYLLFYPWFFAGRLWKKTGRSKVRDAAGADAA